MGSSRWQRGVVELLHELREVESRMRREYSAALELISELDIRDGARECGYPGLTQLLKDVLRVSAAEAKRRIQHANAVTEVPLVSGGTPYRCRRPRRRCARASWAPSTSA